MCDVRSKGVGAAHAYALDFYWEKFDGKTAGLSKLELAGIDMLAWSKTARNVSMLVTFTC